MTKMKNHGLALQVLLNTVPNGSTLTNMKMNGLIADLIKPI